ncbi:MAG: AMP-binding protein [Deltaproteobacteria bacterium]|nr:AMP-binding protein [Deltaproteobacteria bacterium]
MNREDLEQVQLERLQSSLNRAYKNVSYYREQFETQGIDVSSVRTIADIGKFPFTTREDLGSNYPYGLFAVPLRDIVRISSSDGTTSNPVVVGYTKNDLRTRDTMTARFLAAGGVVDTDVVQICLNPGLSNWGLALKEGAEAIGASVMPMSHMSTSKQIMAMQDYKTSVLLTTPSYAMYMFKAMKSMGTDVNALALKAILVVGETLTHECREKLESGLKVDVTAGYGASDVLGPGVAFECQEKNGLHVNEDHFLLEVVAPDSGNPCSQGETGEVVLTTLSTKAFPLIRFRTGDLAAILPGDCPCGRTLLRISEITGQSGDVLTIRGVKVNPAQIQRIIHGIAEDYAPRFLIHLYRQNELDIIALWLEVNDSVFSDEIKVLERTLNDLKYQLLKTLGVPVRIKLVEATTIDEYGKPSGGVVDDR